MRTSKDDQRVHPQAGPPNTAAARFDTVGPPDRTVGFDSAVWLVVFALLIGGAVGGLVVHSLQPHAKRVVVTGRATVIRQQPSTVVRRVTTVVHRTQTKVSYVQTYVPPTNTPTMTVPGDLPDSTDPVVIALNGDRGSALATTADVTATAQACAQRNAQRHRQHVCLGARWSVAQSGTGLTSSGFVRGILTQPDTGWRNDTYTEAASASAMGSDGRTYWALVLTK